MKSLVLARNIRRHAIKMTHQGKSAHIGSVLSIADILAVLYEDIMKTDSKNPWLEDRDRFILSKGHAGAGVYAVLAEKKFFSTEILMRHGQNGSNLSGHVSHKNVPGVEFSTGSLGHGLPVACGMAYAAKLKKQKHRIFVLLSDGECDEGSNWEAILFAAHQKLNNLSVVIDYNKLQSMKSIAETLGLEPFVAKWQSFGWDVSECDGHDHHELNLMLKITSLRPRCIIAHTTKGKGVSFMENQIEWHYRSPQDEYYQQALTELAEL